MVDRSWTFERVWEANEEWLRENPGRSGFDPDSPFSLWAGLLMLDGHEFQYSQGDGRALMSAISECAHLGIPLPAWAARSFIEGYIKIVTFEAKSWDDVLGKPHKKGVHLGKARTRWIKSFPLWVRAKEILASEPDAVIGDHLFERLGKEFGVRKTLASEWYYEHDRSLPAKT